MKIRLSILMMVLIFSCKEKIKNESSSIIVKTETVNGNKTKIDSISSFKKLSDIKIDWSKIQIQTLPFSSTSERKDTVTYKYNKKNLVKSDIHLLFNDSTIFKIKMYDSLFGFRHGHPTKMKGMFWKRLPDIGENKVLTFGYHDVYGDAFVGPAFELQIFNSDNKIVDKVILEDAYHFECGYERKFMIDEGYHISLTDKYQCTSIEEEDSHLNRSKIVKTSFQITPEGFIK